MQALDKLYLAREQMKQAIYEIMGISDIMRGATKASETATAQRIKGSMGVVAPGGPEAAGGQFRPRSAAAQGRDHRQNFDAETLEQMTGEEVTPEVMAILRTDFQRTCSIDIEADSTVVRRRAGRAAGDGADHAVHAAGHAGRQAMLMTGVLPPPQVMQLGLEMLKMSLHPVRFSRGVVELINDFQEQLHSRLPCRR